MVALSLGWISARMHSINCLWMLCWTELATGGTYQIGQPPVKKNPRQPTDSEIDNWNHWNCPNNHLGVRIGLKYVHITFGAVNILTVPVLFDILSIENIMKALFLTVEKINSFNARSVPIPLTNNYRTNKKEQSNNISEPYGYIRIFAGTSASGTRLWLKPFFYYLSLSRPVSTWSANAAFP